MDNRAPRPIDRAKPIIDLIQGDAVAAEGLGRLTDRVATALLEADLFAMLLPVADGGLGCDRVAFFKTVEAVARADGSAGWCLSVGAAYSDFINKAATARAREEVFGSGPVAIFGALPPRARSTPADGGFRVSGAFSLGSGSANAQWASVAEPLEDRAGEQWFRGFIVPKQDVAIVPGSWDVMGLRATSSVDYTLSDQFVPAHRTFEYPFAQGREAGSVSARYLASLNQVGLTAFACGVAQRALAELASAAPKTRRVAGNEGTQADDHVTQAGLGELNGRLRAARSYVLSLLADQDHHVAEQGAPGTVIGVETSLASLTLAHAARDAALFAFENAGASAIYASHPLQRCLRDILTGLKHAAFTPAILAQFGRQQLGLEPVRRRFE
jgi:alkylation response protein AidB-like acyl-CoA dehydrogenase